MVVTVPSARVDAAYQWVVLVFFSSAHLLPPAMPICLEELEMFETLFLLHPGKAKQFDYKLNMTTTIIQVSFLIQSNFYLHLFNSLSIIVLQSYIKIN